MKSIYLPQYSVGNTYLRFLCYSKTNGTFRFSYDCKDDEELLFLGADLINSTLHSNLHTKYWKKGLCIKINLKDVTIKGIPNSRSLWFYTIQGVFQYAFAHLRLSQQKDMVTSLLDHWLKCNEAEAELPKKCDVVMDLFEDESCDGENVTFKDANFMNESHVVLHMSSSPESSTESQNDSPGTDLVKNGDDEGSLPLDLRQNELDDVDAILSRIAATIRTVEGEKQRFCLQRALHLTCRYFESRLPLVPTSFFPFDMLETYLNISSSGFIANEVSTFAANIHDVMLYVVSGWLGKEFLRLKVHVQDEVAAFKQQYIHRLDQLPKPKGLVRELFPACMVELLERWLGVGNERIGEEHNYVKNSARDGNRRTNSYPIIQLILEFANETLISGMSHTLYAQMASAPE